MSEELRQAGETAAAEGAVKTLEELLGQERIAVHNGAFHADDVLCVALLRTLGYKGEILRTRDKEVLQSIVGIDVSGSRTGGQFDHHGADAKAGVCALTKLWAFAKPQLDAKKAASLESFETAFSAVAAVDSGAKDPGEIGIHEFSWVHLVNDGVDESFNAAVVAAEELFQASVEARYDWMAYLSDIMDALKKAKEEESRTIIDYLEASGYNISEEYAEFGEAGLGKACRLVLESAELVAEEWTDTLSEARKAMEASLPVLAAERNGAKEALWRLGCQAHFFVMPYGADEWQVVQTCPPGDEYSPFGCSKFLPKEWAGLRGDALVKASGFKSAVFAFAPKGETVMAFFHSKEDAVKCAEEACK